MHYNSGTASDPSNEISRRVVNPLAPSGGPDPQAQLYTSNVNGSQTAQGNLQQPVATYSTEHPNSAAYELGLAGGDPESLSRAYRQQSLNNFRGMSGGDNLIKRAQQMEQTALSPYAHKASLFNKANIIPHNWMQARKNAEYAQDQIAGGKYLAQGFARGEATRAGVREIPGTGGNLVREPVRRFQTETGDYLNVKQLHGGGYALTSANGPLNQEQIEEIKARREKPITDERVLHRGLEKALKRGKLNKAAKDALIQRGLDPVDYLGTNGKLDKSALVSAIRSSDKVESEDKPKDYLGDNGLKLPDGQFTAATRLQGIDELEALENPKTTEDASHREILRSIGLGGSKEPRDFEQAIMSDGFQEWFQSQQEQTKLSSAHAIARKLRATFSSRGDELTSEGSLLGQSDSFDGGAATEDAIMKVMSVNLDNPNELLEWLEEWQSGIKDRRPSAREAVADDYYSDAAIYSGAQ